MFWFFVIVAFIFVLYALYTQWGHTSVTDAPAKRLMQALGFALAAITAMVGAWFHTPTP